MFTSAGWLGLKRAVDGFLDTEIQKSLRSFFGDRMVDPILASIEKYKDQPKEEHTVIILPGILGTHLKDVGGSGEPRRLWLNLRDLSAVKDLQIAPGETDLEDRDATPGVRIVPDEILVEAYGLLSIYLKHVWGMNVIPFAYDWRRSIDDSARRLREMLPSTNVSFVGHSMGCVVLRRCVHLFPEILGQIEHSICIAAPFAGSYVPLDVVAGGYWLSRAYNKLAGGPFADMLTTCPGFVQMIPSPKDPAIQKLLTPPLTWPKNPLSETLLARANRFIEHLNNPSPTAVRQADQLLRSKTSVILGRSIPTPDRVEWADGKPSFPSRGDGDLMVLANSAKDELAMRHYESLFPHPFIAQDRDVVFGIAALIRSKGEDHGPLKPLDAPPTWLEGTRSMPPGDGSKPEGFDQRQAEGLLNNEDLHYIFRDKTEPDRGGWSPPVDPATPTQ